MSEHSTIVLPSSAIYSSRPKPLLRKQLADLSVRIWGFTCAHPAMASAITGTVGALTLLTYFLPLGFLPDFDFSDITGLLVVAAFFGITQLLWLGAILLLPTILGVSTTFAFRRSGSRLSWPTSTIAAILSQLLWLAMLWYNVANDEIWIGGVLIATLILTVICAKSRKLEGLLSILLAFSLQGGICLLGVLLFRPSPGSFLFELEDWMQWVALGIWCIAISGANLVLAKDSRPTLPMTVGVGAYLIYMLILTTHNLGYVHGLAIRALGLGDIRGVVVTVSDTGASVLKAACHIKSAPPACQAELFTAGEVTGHAYSNVTILSRMGRQHYLQLCSLTDKIGPCATTEGLRVVLDKKEILGWSTAGVEGRKGA